MAEEAGDGAAPPWVLTEVKDGVQVAQHRLRDPVTVLGRSDEADVLLSHASCSRRHATVRLRPPPQGPSIEDASTHGTFVDRRRVQGSAPLRAGSVVQFGASTRLYFVEGPEADDVNDDEEALVLPVGPLDPVERVETTVGTIPTDSRANEDDDDHENPQPISLDLLFRDESQVPEQCHKEWERYKANKFKLENILKESDKILAKGELTTGQERQLERNREKEQHLRDVLLQAEEALLQKLSSNETASSKDRDTYNTEEEEVDDRTGRRPEESSKAETEQSLTARFKSVHKELDESEKLVAEARQAAQRAQERLDLLKAGNDAEEIFFAQNELDLASDGLARMTGRRRELETSLIETVGLLRIANPKLVIDLVTGNIGVERPLSREKETSHAEGSPVNEPRTVKHGPPLRPIDSSTVLEPEPPLHPNRSSTAEGMPPPPPKRIRVAGPSMPLTPSLSQSVSVARGATVMEKPNDASETTAPKISLPNSTLAAMLRVKNPDNVSTNTGKSAKDTSVALVIDNLQTDTWQAPKDQDGNGVTRLNKKFAGRY